MADEMPIEKLLEVMREAAETMMKPPEVVHTFALGVNQDLHYKVMTQPDYVLRVLDAFDTMQGEVERLTAIRQLAGMLIQPDPEDDWKLRLVGHSKFHRSLRNAAMFNGKVSPEVWKEATENREAQEKATADRLALAEALAEAVEKWRDECGIQNEELVGEALEAYREAEKREKSRECDHFWSPWTGKGNDSYRVCPKCRETQWLNAFLEGGVEKR